MLKSPEQKRKDDDNLRYIDAVVTRLQNRLKTRRDKVLQLNYACNFTMNIVNPDGNIEFTPLPLTSVFPPSVLPVNPDGSINHESGVNVNFLQKIADGMLKLYPTSTLINKYVQYGYDWAESVKRAGIDFDKIESDITSSVSTPYTENITQFDSLDTQIIKLQRWDELIGEVIKEVDRISTQIDNLLRTQYNLLAGTTLDKPLNMNHIINPNDAPIDLRGGRSPGDIDVDILNIQKNFKQSVFDYRTKPFLVKDYMDAGYDLSDARKNAIRDTEVIKQRYSTSRVSTQERVVSTDTYQKLLALQEQLKVMYTDVLSMLYRITLLRSAVPRIVSFIFKYLSPEDLEEVLERLEDLIDVEDDPDLQVPEEEEEEEPGGPIRIPPATEPPGLGEEPLPSIPYFFIPYKFQVEYLKNISSSLIELDRYVKIIRNGCRSYRNRWGSDSVKVYYQQSEIREKSYYEPSPLDPNPSSAYAGFNFDFHGMQQTLGVISSLYPSTNLTMGIVMLRWLDRGFGVHPDYLKIWRTDSFIFGHRENTDINRASTLISLGNKSSPYAYTEIEISFLRIYNQSQQLPFQYGIDVRYEKNTVTQAQKDDTSDLHSICLNAPDNTLAPLFIIGGLKEPITNIETNLNIIDFLQNNVYNYEFISNDSR